jgi:hypothetical protein
VRVGTWVGSGNFERAQSSSWLLIRFTGYVILCVAAIIKAFPQTIGEINTSDPDVLAALPIPISTLALFAVVDSMSGTIQVTARLSFAHPFTVVAPPRRRRRRHSRAHTLSLCKLTRFRSTLL